MAGPGWRLGAFPRPQAAACTPGRRPGSRFSRGCCHTTGFVFEAPQRHRAIGCWSEASYSVPLTSTDPDRSVDEVGPFAVGVILSLVTGSSLGMPSAQLVGGLRIRMATVPGRPGRLTPAPDGGRSSSDSGAVPLPLPARLHQCASGSAPAFVLARTSRESLATALLRADSGTRESTRSSGGRAQSYVPRVRVKTDREARRSRAASRPRRTSYRRGRRLGSARS